MSITLNDPRPLPRSSRTRGGRRPVPVREDLFTGLGGRRFPCASVRRPPSSSSSSRRRWLPSSLAAVGRHPDRGDRLFTTAWDPEPSHRHFGALAFASTAPSSPRVIAMLPAVPVGVGTATYLCRGRLAVESKAYCHYLVEMLAAIPSVVYGFWGAVTSCTGAATA